VWENDYWSAVAERLLKTLLQALLGGLLAAGTALVAALVSSGSTAAYRVVPRTCHQSDLHQARRLTRPEFGRRDAAR